MYRFVETTGASGGPLVFTFHGTGGHASQFHGLAQELLPGAHVISPQGDVNEGGAARFFKRTGEGVYDMDDLGLRRDVMRDFLTKAIARVQPSRVIGLGYSNGANILAAVMLDGSKLFDQVILMHPLIPWQPVPNHALQKVKVLVTAGQRDPICPAAMTQSFADSLSAQGADICLKWHSGGHEVDRIELDAAQEFLTS